MLEEPGEDLSHVDLVPAGTKAQVVGARSGRLFLAQKADRDEARLSRRPSQYLAFEAMSWETSIVALLMRSHGLPAGGRVMENCTIDYGRMLG